mmetsp:Transcript_10849/g.20637  ORF Transcript_10849/g.20637 Transcript_10849/m.20637 type:complete len:845 (+) Transcript_10849:201-2735(+)
MSRAKGSSRLGESDMIPSAHKDACFAIKAVTGASEEEIYHVLKACNFDIDQTTNTLLDSPFETFQSKGKKKKGTMEAKKAMPKSVPLDVNQHRRPMSGGPGNPSGRGGRGGRSGMGGPGGRGASDRGPPRDNAIRGGYRGGPGGPPPHTNTSADGVSWDGPAKSVIAVPRSSSSAPGAGDQRVPLFSRGVGPAGASEGASWDGPPHSQAPPEASPATQPPPPPAPIRPMGVAQPGQRSVADVLKGNLNQSVPNASSFPQDSMNQESSSQNMRAPAPASASPGFNSLMSSFPNQQSSMNKEVAGGAWAANAKPSAPPVSAEGVASSLAEMRVHEEEASGMPMPSQFGDFGGMGGDFGSGFGGGGFGSASDATTANDAQAAPPPPTGPAAGAAPMAPPPSTNDSNDPATMRAPAQFQTPVSQAGYSSFAQPTASETTPTPAPEKASEPASSHPMSAMHADAQQQTTNMMQGAVPPYYGGMQPYSFIGMPGMPSGPGYHSYESVDQSSDMSRLSQMGYAQDPTMQQHQHHQHQHAYADTPASVNSGGTGESEKAGGVLPPQPPSNPPPSSSAAGMAAAHTSQQAAAAAHQLQMHAAYAGLPPGMAPGAQYGHMYPTYPYGMPPNTGYHYMHSPYSHYGPQGPGGAYAAQAGSSTFSPVAGSYPGQPGAPSGPVKFPQHAVAGYKPVGGVPGGAGAAAAYAAYAAGGQSALYPAAGAAGGYGAAGDEAAGMPAHQQQQHQIQHQQQHRAGQYKDSGLYVPGQAAGPGVGQEATSGPGGAPQSSYYTPAAYAVQGQSGFPAQGQYAAAQYAAQGQYWQNAQVLMQQAPTLAAAPAGQHSAQYNNKQQLL